MTIRTIRVPWTDPRAVALRELMDREIVERYTGRHDDDPDFASKAAVAFALDPADVVAVVLGIDDAGEAVAHAALRRLAGRYEVKRVIVLPQARGAGVGRLMMAAIEEAARECGADSVILQTGDRQPDAVALYSRIGYRPIPVYEPYRAVTNSMCFEKQLA
ncbi:GNAT family N-acetyltransferase [Marisediminicola senii]|uniref:GNAT family N-acetyltransferase n=1 Tax=Marisediminicola senii TaxID=2711233 RepID=UPI001F2C82CD|nr:GNAT family N-acetyltransferase [Marisediminicola senii]